MINTAYKLYNYSTLGQLDEYGQPAPTDTVVGQVKMAIYSTSTSIQDNIKYKGSSYIGLTPDAQVNDTYIIIKENEQLKVQYVERSGRLNQVFMVNI